MTDVHWTILRDAAKQALVWGDFEAAEARTREAQRLATGAGASLAEISALQRDLIDILVGRGAFADAQQLGEAWLQVLERDPEAAGPQLGIALMTLGVIAGARDDVRHAISLFRRARKALETTLGAWDPEVAECLREHATILIEHERYDEALPLYRRALAIFEAELGPETQEVAETLTAVGDCLAAAEDYYGAKRYLRRALMTSERAFGMDTLEAARAAQDLAEFYLDYEEYEDAAPLLHRALGIFEAETGLNSLNVADCLRALSVLHGATNQAELALLDYRRAVAIWESDPGHAEMLSEIYTTVAELAEAAGRGDDARAARQRAEDLQKPR
jgi:tetratricopeptide (TPR) repeat protein